ncbi:kinase-like protein [Xylaria arbuscula]|nr:kinase-like protein [Xylaria arbuscula]
MSGAANDLGPRRFFQHLSENYENQYWEYEKRLGFGAFGYTALLKSKGPPGQPGKRMAVKFAVGTTSNRQGTLRTEINFLKTFNGASHIVSILASCEDIGPVVALEYLEHGDMNGLMLKLRQRERTVPNTVLWSLFFCLIRASVGMAYPPRHPVGSDVKITEVIPSDGTRESQLAHNDFNARNIMLGVGDGRHSEHGMGIMAKLIDFGTVTLGHGSLQNIFDAAFTISFLITPATGISNQTCMYRGQRTRAVNLVGTGEPPFPLPQSLTNDVKWLDPELRDLLARCTYFDPTQRPTLSDVLQIAQNAVQSKVAESFPIPDMETTSAVKSFIQEFILDVPGQ